MANVRLRMKFRDGKISWTETHYWYPGPWNTGSTPPVQPAGTIPNAIAQATSLVAKRYALLNYRTALTGCILSTDDGIRNAYPVPGGFQIPNQPTSMTALDPQLSAVITATSNGMGYVASPPPAVVPPQHSYQEDFYLAGLFVQDVNDQSIVAVQFATGAYQAYIAALTTVQTATGWGWRALIKETVPLNISIPAGAASPVVNTVAPLPPGIVVTAATSTAAINEGDVVRLSGIFQTTSKLVKLNGRWRVYANNVSTNTLTLVRKNYLALQPLGYLAGGVIYYSLYGIVPYTSLATVGLDKRDRGGKLGLRRGRYKQRPVTV